MMTEFAPVMAACEDCRHDDALQLLLGLFERADHSPHDDSLFFITVPQAAQRDAFLALEAMVEVGDYALSETYLGDPLAGLDRLNECALTHVLIPPSRQPPRLSAELTNFSKDVRLLCAVHRGLGRVDAADTLRTTALVGIISDELRAWAVRELDDPGALFRELSARDAESL